MEMSQPQSYSSQPNGRFRPGFLNRASMDFKSLQEGLENLLRNDTWRIRFNISTVFDHPPSRDSSHEDLSVSPEENLESFKIATLARYFLEESETLFINGCVPLPSHTAVSQMDDPAVLPLTNGSI